MAIQRTILNARRRELKARQAENEAIKYTVDWAAQLDTDTVSTSAWTSEDNGITIASDAISSNQTYATLSGSTGRYRVVNKITTTAGFTLERYIDLTIMDNSKTYSGGYSDYRWIS